MYWKTDQRLPVDGTQSTTPFHRDRAPARTSGDGFATLLAGRIDTPASPGFANFLSTDTVKLLAMALNLSTSDTTDTTTAWMVNMGVLPNQKTLSQPEPPAARSLHTPSETDSSATGISPHITTLIDRAASRYHLDPALISSVIKQESDFDTQAVSPAGAQGLMQLMPETARELNVTNAFDPAQNIDGGSRYLAGLIQRYHGNVKLALAAYNWGMGNLEHRHHSMPAETRHYVASIMKRWQQNPPIA